MKFLSVLFVILALAAAAAGATLLLTSGPARAAEALRPNASAHRAISSPMDASGLGARSAPNQGLESLHRPAPRGKPLSEPELARIRAEAAERAERVHRGRIVDRERLEGDWLRVLGSEVANQLELPIGSGRALADILLQERDRESAAWAASRKIKQRARSRELLKERMVEIRAWRRAELDRTFGEEPARRIHDLLEQGGPGVDGEPGALARAGG